ncbi:MAG: clostripain-related cysteine peptidase [Elusimicrobiales bacterium]|jgi:hypothetical protein
MERKILLMFMTACAALTVNVNAQNAAFSGLMADQDWLKAAADAVQPPSPVAPKPAAAPVVAPAAQREWLVLVFLNGLNDLGLRGPAARSINDMETVGSSDNVSVVAEYGIVGADPASGNIQFQRGSKTIYVQRDDSPEKITSPVIYTSNDRDMGSAAHLVRFVKRGIRRFPAKKVAVIVWNHGKGFYGVSYDDVSGNTITVDQLGRAMTQVKQALGRKVDVFATDACLMQMAEVAYELKDAVEVVVGSEETIPGTSYSYANLLSMLDENPDLDAEGFGVILVGAYGAYYGDSVQRSSVTLSAVRTSALPGFVERLDSWVAAVRNDPKVFAAAASKAVAKATHHFAEQDFKDLYDYIGNVDKAAAKNQAVRNAGAALQNYIANTLVISDTGFVKRAHGLSIYLPEAFYKSDEYEKFTFARDSIWDDFIREISEERLKKP